MTRHARNCTAGCVYSYHERKRDTKKSGYGSQNIRLGKDSIKEFDCCCLTLQPCANPVITPDGFLFDKEYILEYILTKKKDISKKLRSFEKQKLKENKEATELYKAENEAKLQKFTEKQTMTVGKFLDKKDPIASTSGAEAGPSSSTSSGGATGNASDTRSVASNDKQLPSFWIPSLTPKAAATKLEKPDEKVRCPMSGKPIRMKDLMDIHFTPIKDDGKKSVIAKQARYVCAVTNDVLGNSVPCAALKTSGAVVTMECVEKLIKKDMLDPINGKTLTDRDIIPLQRGATGFSSAGLKLEAKIDGPAIQA